MAARTAHAGSKGLRTARIPQARAARSTGRSTAGKHVRVLVSVDVRQMQAFALLQMRDLRRGFGFDFLRADAARKKARQKCRERSAGSARSSRSTREGILLRRQHRLAIDKNHVAADAK